LYDVIDLGPRARCVIIDWSRDTIYVMEEPRFSLFFHNVAELRPLRRLQHIAIDHRSIRACAKLCRHLPALKDITLIGHQWAGGVRGPELIAIPYNPEAAYFGRIRIRKGPRPRTFTSYLLIDEWPLLKGAQRRGLIGAKIRLRDLVDGKESMWVREYEECFGWQAPAMLDIQTISRVVRAFSY